MKQILLRLIIFTVTVAASTTLNAATDNNPSIIKHEVKRGETLESIAAQYGISPSEIENLNPYTRCYTGIILDIPVSSSMQEIEENKKIALNSDYYNGQLYLDRKDYKKSIECYSKIINQGDATLIAYYNRGVAWYNNGKLRQAMDDFSHVMRYDNLGRFPDAKSLYDNAYSRQAQRDAAKAQMWGDFIGTLATTAATVYVAVEQNKKQSRSASKSSSSSTSSSSDNSSSGSNEATSSPSPSSSQKNEKCGLCGGKGYLVEYTASYGIVEYEYCDECGKKMQTTHWHKKCQQCGGSGVR